MDDQEKSQTSAPAEDDALKDADIKSGKVGAEEEYHPRSGEAKEASDTTPQEAGSL